MYIYINGKQCDIPVELGSVLAEALRLSQDCCKCEFDRHEEYYTALSELIEKRKQEPFDLSCIE